MAQAAPDPYAVLGLARDASEAELRRAYRALVKLHHPDHNGGSRESAARFAQIQQAYAAITERRRPPGASADPPPASTPRASDPAVDDRIDAIERELAAAREAQDKLARAQAARAREERARREQLAREQLARELAARGAAGAAGPPRGSAATGAPRRATPEELGYYSTEDSLAKIVDDAAGQLGERLRRSDAKKELSRRLSDLFGRGR